MFWVSGDGSGPREPDRRGSCRRREDSLEYPEMGAVENRPSIQIEQIRGDEGQQDDVGVVLVLRGPQRAGDDGRERLPGPRGRKDDQQQEGGVPPSRPELDPGRRPRRFEKRQLGGRRGNRALRHVSPPRFRTERLSGCGGGSTGRSGAIASWRSSGRGAPSHRRLCGFGP